MKIFYVYLIMWVTVMIITILNLFGLGLYADNNVLLLWILVNGIVIAKSNDKLLK